MFWQHMCHPDKKQKKSLYVSYPDLPLLTLYSGLLLHYSGITVDVYKHVREDVYVWMYTKSCMYGCIQTRV
jgi:hypothetical protein